MSVAGLALTDYGRRDVWLAARAKGIGASDAAKLFTDDDGCSLSPHGTSYTLWLEKTGQITPDVVDSEHTEMGHRLEPVIADIYADRTGRKVVHAGPFCVAVHRRLPFMRATPDRYVPEAHDRMGRGLCQIKNAGWYKAHDWSEGVPLAIQIQVQAEMACTGFDWDSVAVLLGGWEFRTFDVERDLDFIAVLEDRAAWFWDLVERFKAGDMEAAPPVDGSAKTTEALKRLHPKDDGSIVRLPEESLAWLQAMQDAKADAEMAETAARWAENKLRAAIGAATWGELPNGRRLSLKTTDVKGGTKETEPYSYRTLRLEKADTKGKSKT
jgi:putative phage-type endonuclease